MNVINIEFLSEVLNSRKKLNILMPEFSELKHDEKLPIIYCLHGLTGNCDDWLISGGAKEIFKNYRFIAVFPSADNSFYCNMKHGYNYFDHIAYEIPKYVESLFPADTSKRYIAGLSMGGYGALKIALSNPERYKAAAAFSGVLDIASLSGRMKEQDIRSALVPCFGEEMIVPDNSDLFKLAKNKNIDIPIYVSCGTEDLLYEQSAKFVESNPHLKIKFISEPGEHEWKLWNLNLARFMEEINKSLV